MDEVRVLNDAIRETKEFYNKRLSRNTVDVGYLQTGNSQVFTKKMEFVMQLRPLLLRIW